MFFWNNVIDFVRVKTVLLTEQTILAAPARAFDYQPTQNFRDIRHDSAYASILKARAFSKITKWLI